MSSGSKDLHRTGKVHQVELGVEAEEHVNRLIGNGGGLVGSHDGWLCGGVVW